MPLLTNTQKKKLTYFLPSFLIHISLEKLSSTSSVLRIKDIKKPIDALYWEKNNVKNAQQICAWYYCQKQCQKPAAFAKSSLAEHNNPR